MKRYETFLDKHCGQPFANIEEDANGGLVMYDEAQAEIDRLRSVNDELLVALEKAAERFYGLGFIDDAKRIDAAIAKARGES
jgi:hypothetical protein